MTELEKLKAKKKSLCIKHMILSCTAMLLSWVM